uniref:Uncharacterized protein n=1 Tax=Anguilla anguilla TaxID=7936 RepID=A0A0E9WVX9_ANGAN
MTYFTENSTKTPPLACNPQNELSVDPTYTILNLAYRVCPESTFFPLIRQDSQEQGTQLLITTLYTQLFMGVNGSVTTLEVFHEPHNGRSYNELSITDI